MVVRLVRIGTQVSSHTRSAPSFSLGGGPSRRALARQASGVGPGPAYLPSAGAPGPSVTFSTGPRTSFAVGTTGPGPGGADVRSGATGPAFSIGTSLRNPKDKGTTPLPAPPVGPKPMGFGYGCSLEEHIRYGQCIDGLCSTRGNWEAVATRETEYAEATQKRRTRRARKKTREARARAVLGLGHDESLTRLYPQDS